MASKGVGFKSGGKAVGKARLKNTSRSGLANVRARDMAGYMPNRPAQPDVMEENRPQRAGAKKGNARPNVKFKDPVLKKTENTESRERSASYGMKPFGSGIEPPGYNRKHKITGTVKKPVADRARAVAVKSRTVGMKKGAKSSVSPGTLQTGKRGGKFSVVNGYKVYSKK